MSDEMLFCLLTSSQNKVLETELGYASEKESRQREEVKEANATVEELRMKVQRLEWDLSDSSKLKNQRILDLENQVCRAALR